MGKAQEGWGARGKPHGGARVGPGRPCRALFSQSSPGGPGEPLLPGGVQASFSSGHPVTREGQRGQRMARAAWRRLCDSRGEAGTLPGEAHCSWPLAPQLRGVLGYLQAGSTQAPAGRWHSSVVWACIPSRVIAWGVSSAAAWPCVSSQRDVYSGPLPIFKLGWF